MENLKKAKEIACMIEEDLMESSHMTRSDIELVGEYAQGAAMRMAQWKDKEFNKIDKAIVVTETYYVISFRKYKHNCEVETHKYYDYDEAVKALKVYNELCVYGLEFNKIVEDKFDVGMVIKR